MAAGGGGQGDLALAYTPTWVVSLICFLIIMISLVAERGLHKLGKKLKKNKQKPLYEALLKVKEELMLLGFISLMLVVFQSSILHICVSPSLMKYMLPCKKEDNGEQHSETAHYTTSFSTGVLGSKRKLLASGGGAGSEVCAAKQKVPLLSLSAIHALHIFIFVLAVTHVIFCAFTMVLGSLKIQWWKHWEERVQHEVLQTGTTGVTLVHKVTFIKERYKGFGKQSSIMRWVFSFFKQFYGSVTRADYETMRLGFIMCHCRGNPKFNFYEYMIRALEADFKKVVGISWYLWIFVILFMLVNVHGWMAYFWLSFLPFILLLTVGTKLEHIITELAHDVADKHVAVEGDLVINPSDDHFWFRRPKIILNLIQFILFQNAFEIAVLFWIWTTFGFNSCFMEKSGFVISRLVIGIIIQVLCSYSTLPLYAIVTQMGSSFKRAIFDESVQEGLVGWAKKARNRMGVKTNPAPRNTGKMAEDVLLEKMGPETGRLAISR